VNGDLFGCEPQALRLAISAPKRILMPLAVLQLGEELPMCYREDRMTFRQSSDEELTDTEIREFAFFLASHLQEACGDLLIPFQQIYTRTRPLAHKPIEESD
jgi:hypothetical protein